MVMKLQRAGAAASAASSNTEERRVPSGWGKPAGDAAPQAEAAANQEAPAAEERKAPSGWGKPAGSAPSAAQEQRAEIADKLNPETQADPEAGAGFSADVIALRGQVEGGGAEEAPFDGGQTAGQAEAPAARNTRSPRAKPQGDDGTLQEIRHELSALHAEVALLHANHGVDQDAPQTDEEKAAQAERDTTYLLQSLLVGAKDAAQAVATLEAMNPGAAQEAYELLFGAIEKRLAAHGLLAA